MFEYILIVHAFCSTLTDDQLVTIVGEIQAQANARPLRNSMIMHSRIQFELSDWGTSLPHVTRKVTQCERVWAQDYNLISFPDKGICIIWERG